ncbi:MAG TPA: hypothetical protein VID73_04905 [Ktedonobacterales bacterium]|jgi:hypothetical protein
MAGADELALAPEALDAWLRAELGRRLAITGVTLVAPRATPPEPPAAPPDSRGVLALAGAAPTALPAALAEYAEIWLRWLPAGARLDEAAIRAAAGDADALLVWLAPTGTETPTGWPERTLAALHDALANLSLRDGCVLALGGAGASRALARRLGYDDGFAPEAPAGAIATTLAREALALAAVRGGGSSPPCYL